MQEINLLQNRVKDHTLSWERRNRVIITLFTLFLILEILGGVGLYILTRSTDSQVQDMQSKNADIQSSMDSSQTDLAAAKGIQSGLKNLKVLLNNHIYWSAFFDKLSSVTTNKIQYLSINSSTNDGKVRLNGVAASYLDVGKLVLSLSTTDGFNNVKLSSVSASSGKTLGYNFILEFNASPKSFTKK